MCRALTGGRSFLILSVVAVRVTTCPTEREQSVFPRSETELSRVREGLKSLESRGFLSVAVYIGQ